MFQIFQSFLAYLFALLTTYVFFRVFHPAFLRKAGRELRRQFGVFGCVFLFCTISLLAGRVVSKGIRSTPPSQIIPEWFTALGYDPADTDGDGIPDCWERWTRTNRAVADDGLDPDGDGVDNFGEFWNQCDPMMADTDGDGFSDYVEIAGKAVGKTWCDPIVPASFAYDDPDANTNGVPDRWEGTGYIYGFTDANGDGFPDGLTFPEAGGGNFDIEVVVSTTRAALLSWGTSTSEAIVLPPCSCLPIRLRLSGLTDTDVRLSCGTAGDGSEGLWYGRLVIRWPDDCGYETERGRLQIESDAVIECEAMEVSFRGEVQTELQRTPQGDIPTTITSPFRRKWINVFGISGGCWEHDTNGVAAIAVYTNIAPPFVWYIDDGKVDDWHEDYLPIGAFPTNGTHDIHFSCEWTGEVQHNTIRIMDSNSIRLYHCPPDTTNLYPITDLDGFDVMTNHVPDRVDYPTDNSGNCPKTHHWSIWAGYAHGGEKPWERNFETIPTGSAEDDETSHCHAIDWSKNLEIDLEEYLPEWLLDYKDKLRYRANGAIVEGTTIYVGKDKPDDLLPDIYHVEVCKTEGATLDRLWIVVLAPETRTNFNNWVSENTTNSTWLSLLPKPPSKLTITSGLVSLPSAASSNWNPPEIFSTNNFMHPKAVYELRSKPVSGGHGHQATYDAQGNLITESIKAGTADIASPSERRKLGRVSTHKYEDVHPYIRALQLDGNPIHPDNALGIITKFAPRNLSRPPLRVGPFTEQYLQLRPPVPTGVLSIP